jgi:hypothetical protein
VAVPAEEQVVELAEQRANPVEVSIPLLAATKKATEISPSATITINGMLPKAPIRFWPA